MRPLLIKSNIGKTFSALFNSDFLKQRRSGNQRSINEAELSAAVANSDKQAKSSFSLVITKGLLTNSD
jgi:hypothetical protein